MAANPDGSLFINHNVYILGAGFSTDRGLPILRDFLDRMRDAREHVATREGDAIDIVLRFRRAAAAAADRIAFDSENIEELFSLAELSDDRQVADAIPLAIAATIDHAHRTSTVTRVQIEAPTSLTHPAVWSETARVEDSGNRTFLNPPVYDIYLACIMGSLSNPGRSQRDTFITLNYDTVVEEAAQRMGIEIDYCIPSTPFGGLEPTPSSRTLRLLKLHGSVNWARGQSPSEPCLIAPGYSALQAEHLSPLIVPPTWRKTLAAPLGAVWQQAIAELSAATRIAIVGYSIPPSDSHFRYLLAAGLKDNISLRRITFVNLEQHAQVQDDRPMHPVELRARDMMRAEWWKSGRATYSRQGSANFFLHQLRTAEWNRPWIDGASARW